MSTYLLAIAVSDFDYIEDKYRNITLRIWATSDTLPYCGYALGLLSKALSFYEDYFNISYPLSKLDVYGVPELRVVGMENWGMITIQTGILTYDPSFSSTSDKAKTIMTIFHEVAHMNLSDPLIDVDQVFHFYVWPTINRDEDRLAPILSPNLEYENSISGVFNVASYYKGEALIQMIKKVTGDNFFQRTLQNFIKTHIYDNVISDHLADALTRALQVYDHNNPFDGMPVNQVMKSWTHKQGFPTIMVKTVNSTTVSLYQTSFHSIERQFINDSWIVPIFYKENLNSDEQKIVWLKDNRTVLLNNMAVIDPNFYGYYKILYDKIIYRKLADILLKDHELISKAGRSKLLFESFIFQRYGILTTEPLELIRYVSKEIHEGPFMIVFNFLELFYTMFPNDPNFKEYQFNLLVPVYERVNLDRSEQAHEQVRRMLTQRLCSWGYQKCKDHVTAEFGLLMEECKDGLLSSTCNKITPGIRTGIYSMAIKYGPSEYFDFLWEKYLVEDNLFEKERILQGLTGTTVSDQIEKLVSYQMYNDTKLLEPHMFWTFFLNTGNIEELRPILDKNLHEYISHLVNISLSPSRGPKGKIHKFLSYMIMVLYRVLPTPENLSLVSPHSL
ncbi:hypothetical protein FO519_008288 [Halicephalobus sp. NKZ332]|nr:hypothetical protein FO519_008288 [Halicephalobus sp. NKZ332]